MTLREAGVQLFDCDHRTPTAVAEGVPYIAIPQLKDGRIDFSGARRISHEDFIEWTRKTRPTAGDIVLSRRCNPGETAVVPEHVEFALGQNLVLLRADGVRSDNGFLRWAVRGPEWWEQIGKFINVGAVFESLRCKDILDFELRFPPIHAQRSIASLLNILDSNVSDLRLQSGTLDAIARTIFKSWFVDFDPVRAKAEGREPDGMDAATAGVFPGEIKESKSGAIPLGWSSSPFDSIADFLNGLALQKYPVSSGEDSVPAIKIAQLKRRSTEGADRISARLPAKYLVHDGDLIFSWSGSLEVDVWCGGEGALNQHLFKVTSETYPQWFIYGWLLQHLEHFREIAASKVTTMGHIQRHHLHDATVVVPTSEALQGLGELMQPLHERVIQSRLQMRTLAELRDTLLPRLISGKLRVPEAEKLVEAML
jgi:type I restriction enzyme S subunit